MSIGNNDVSNTRRRGAALEEALLDAAWAALAEKGYDQFTMDAVAVRAQTSRAVLYRRWADRAELAIAAIQRKHSLETIRIPDTGNFREDLIDYLKEFATKRGPFLVLVHFSMASFFTENNLSFADLREKLILNRPSGVEILLLRAVERGQVDPSQVTPRIMTMPGHLIAYELLMNSTIGDGVIEEIVDQLVLPLVQKGPQ